MKIIATLFAALALTLSASAQTHTIDFTQEVKGLDDKPIMQPLATDSGAKPVALTLGDVAVNALVTPMDGDIKLTGEDKFKMNELARKIYKHKAVVLTAEDLKLVKERIGKLYAATVVGYAWHVLDGEPGGAVPK